MLAPQQVDRRGSFEDRVPVTDSLGRPSTLTIYRQPGSSGIPMNPFMQVHGSAGSAGSARMQSMLDGSYFAPQARPQAAHSAGAPLPLANSAAAPSITDLPAIMDGIDGGQSAGGPSAGQPQAENGEEPVLRTAVSAAELREKVLAARKVVFAGRKARVSFFSFCYPHQRRRRGYNRAETRMRWWICSSRRLALILLMPPLKAIAVMKKPAAAGAAAQATKLKTVSPPEHN